VLEPIPNNHMVTDRGQDYSTGAIIMKSSSALKSED